MRTRVTTDKGRMPTAGKRTLQYRGIKGQVRDCIALGPGSSSGLKLRVYHLRAGAAGSGTDIIDNVPLGTGIKQTNVYFWAKPA